MMNNSNSNNQKMIAKITIENSDKEKIKRLGTLMQYAVNHIEHDDMIRLLEKVKQNNSIVKKALKFI